MVTDAKVLFLFYIRKKQGSKRVRDFPKATQPVNDSVRVRPRVSSMSFL